MSCLVLPVSREDADLLHRGRAVFYDCNPDLRFPLASDPTLHLGNIPPSILAESMLRELDRLQSASRVRIFLFQQTGPSRSETACDRMAKAVEDLCRRAGIPPPTIHLVAPRDISPCSRCNKRRPIGSGTTCILNHRCILVQDPLAIHRELARLLILKAICHSDSGSPDQVRDVIVGLADPEASVVPEIARCAGRLARARQGLEELDRQLETASSPSMLNRAKEQLLGELPEEAGGEIEPFTPGDPPPVDGSELKAVPADEAEKDQDRRLWRRIRSGYVSYAGRLLRELDRSQAGFRFAETSADLAGRMLQNRERTQGAAGRIAESGAGKAFIQSQVHEAKARKAQAIHRLLTGIREGERDRRVYLAVLRAVMMGHSTSDAVLDGMVRNARAPNLANHADSIYRGQTGASLADLMDALSRKEGGRSAQRPAMAHSLVHIETESRMIEEKLKQRPTKRTVGILLLAIGLVPILLEALRVLTRADDTGWAILGLLSAGLVSATLALSGRLAMSRRLRSLRRSLHRVHRSVREYVATLFRTDPGRDAMTTWTNGAAALHAARLDMTHLEEAACILDDRHTRIHVHLGEVAELMDFWVRQMQSSGSGDRHSVLGRGSAGDGPQEHVGTPDPFLAPWNESTYWGFPVSSIPSLHFLPIDIGSEEEGGDAG